MTTNTDIAQAVDDLISDSVRSRHELIEGDRAWLPLDRPVPEDVVAAAAAIPQTPALLWDLKGLSRNAQKLQRLFGEYGIEVNLAMKSCSSIEVVRTLADLGMGADAASPQELRWAVQAGFEEVSACGPGFGVADIPELEAVGSILDAVSLRQVRAFRTSESATQLGLRLRVPFPDHLLSPTSRGRNSRFGLDLTDELIHELSTGPVPIRRVRVHTGESTSLNLAFRASYAMLCADRLGTVETVNLGGGFLRLARQPAELRRALDQLAPVLLAGTARNGQYRITVEPGGALMADHAYLVTEILDIDKHPLRGRMVTVDSSAWNIAPWSKTTFYCLGNVDGDDAAPIPTTVVGPSLYEQDAFTHSGGEDRYSFPLGALRPGDRLIGTSVGSYTVTNGRSFHGLPVPPQYAATLPKPTLLHGPLAYAEQCDLGSHTLRHDRAAVARP